MIVTTVAVDTHAEGLVLSKIKVGTALVLTVKVELYASEHEPF